jgi:hypothetical protein
MIKSIINYFKKYPYVLVMLLIILVWGTFNTIEANNIEKLLKENGKYTIATIKDIKGAHSGRFVKVEFEYKKIKYESERRNETIPITRIGEKIFIKFLPTDPVNCDYYDDIEIPDSILKRPPQIWDTLPVPAN